MDLTKEQIEQMEKAKEAIEHCVWRIEVSGVAICRCNCIPCQNAIVAGNCVTLIDLFKGENNE